jgi:hypothetical protein
VNEPWYTLDYTFVVEPGEARLPTPPVSAKAEATPELEDRPLRLDGGDVRAAEAVTARAPHDTMRGDLDGRVHRVGAPGTSRTACPAASAALSAAASVAPVVSPDGEMVTMDRFLRATPFFLYPTIVL